MVQPWHSPSWWATLGPDRPSGCSGTPLAGRGGGTATAGGRKVGWLGWDFRCKLDIKPLNWRIENQSCKHVFAWENNRIQNMKQKLSTSSIGCCKLNKKVFFLGKQVLSPCGNHKDPLGARSGGTSKARRVATRQMLRRCWNPQNLLHCCQLLIEIIWSFKCFINYSHQNSVNWLVLNQWLMLFP